MIKKEATNQSIGRTVGDDDFDKLANEYLQECEHSIEQLEVQIMTTLSAKDPKEGLRSLTRTVHSIKGASGSYGFDLISSVCHNFEDRLLAFQYSEREFSGHVDGLLRYVDLLMSVCKAYINKDHSALGRISSQLKGQIMPSVVKTSANGEAIAVQEVKRKRILVIESTRSIQIVLNRLFAQYDPAQVEVSNARDGYEGLGRILKEKFDLVVMSNLAEWVSGEELLKVMQTVHSPNSKTSFILLTSSEGKALPTLTNPVHLVVKSDKFVEHTQQAILKILGPGATTPTGSNEAAAFPYKKILLVDDSKDIHMLVGLSTKKDPSIQLRSAYGGNEGVLLAASFSPDLILIDFNMPDMDGIEASRLIKAKRPNTPIIFLTGASREEERKRLMAEKPLGIIKKPFPPKTLLTAICEFKK